MQINSAPKSRCSRVARDNSATSILEILNADLDQGATATLEPHGPDAERAVVTLVKLLSEFRE